MNINRGFYMTYFSSPQVFAYHDQGAEPVFTDIEGRPLNVRSPHLSPGDKKHIAEAGTVIKTMGEKFCVSTARSDNGYLSEGLSYDELGKHCHEIARGINPHAPKPEDGNTLTASVSSLRGISVKKILSQVSKMAVKGKRFAQAVVVAAVIACAGAGPFATAQVEAAPAQRAMPTSIQAASFMGYSGHEVMLRASIRMMSLHLDSAGVCSSLASEDIQKDFDAKYFSRTSGNLHPSTRKTALWEHGMTIASAAELLSQKKTPRNVKGVEFTENEEHLLKALSVPSKKVMLEIFAPDSNGGSPHLPMWLIQQLSRLYLENELGHAPTTADLAQMASGDKLHALMGAFCNPSASVVQKSVLLSNWKSKGHFDRNESGGLFDSRESVFENVRWNPCILVDGQTPAPEQIADVLKEAAVLLERDISPNEVRLFLDTLSVESSFGRDRSYMNARGAIQMLLSTYDKMQHIIAGNEKYSEAVNSIYDVTMSQEDNLVHNLSLNAVLFFIYCDENGGLSRIKDRLNTEESRWNFYHKIYNAPPADQTEIGTSRERFASASAWAGKYLKSMEKDGFDPNISSHDTKIVFNGFTAMTPENDQPHEDFDGEKVFHESVTLSMN